MKYTYALRGANFHIKAGSRLSIATVDSTRPNAQGVAKAICAALNAIESARQVVSYSDDTGCCDDLTVTSLSAVENLSDFVEIFDKEISH